MSAELGRKATEFRLIIIIFLQENKFISGDANNKPKDAREKTSGLVALGLIDDNRKLTSGGTELLKTSLDVEKLMLRLS